MSQNIKTVRLAWARRSWRGLVPLVVAVAALSCSSDEPVSPTPGNALRVLFIGNSLTYENSLPEMVTALAKASDAREIETASVAIPNFALIDHINFSDAVAQVRTGNYDVVVLQQGPSSLPINRDSLRLTAAMFATEIRAAGGRPALYAVWPDATRLFAFPDVSESYRLAAEDVDGYFFPVGDTWLEAWNLDPDTPLYGADNFHPSETGTYAAAVVIVSVLTGRAPSSLADEVRLANGWLVRVSQPDAVLIQQAAATVLARHPQTPPN